MIEVTFKLQPEFTFEVKELLDQKILNGIHNVSTYAHVISNYYVDDEDYDTYRICDFTESIEINQGRNSKLIVIDADYFKESQLNAKCQEYLSKMAEAERIQREIRTLEAQ